SVTVFEKADRVGGLLRYGIPNFKLEKHVVDRRVQQLAAEGVEFVTNAHVGVNVPVERLRKEYDAVLLAGGAEQPRDLQVPGRELKGIHYAMEFLPQQNRRNEGELVEDSSGILATGKHVVIIGSQNARRILDELALVPPILLRQEFHRIMDPLQFATGHL